MQTSVVIIGGGATGVGILRDLSMRGIPAVLLEQGDLAHGTSSRFHGLLHSGARYAVNDEESARECIEENAILRRVARHCVELTEGYFVRTVHDDPAFTSPWLLACARAGITATPVDVHEARVKEPHLEAGIKEVYAVPDACIDGFRLVWHNAQAARRLGGKFLTRHRVTGISQNNGMVTGVDVFNTVTNEALHISCQMVVNATGSWSGVVARMAGLDVPVSPDRGTLIVFNHRFTSRVINRLHPSSDGDIFVPHGSVTIYGTTSTPTDKPDNTTPTAEEVLRLMDLGRPLFADIDNYRILRVFAGTRPLYTPNSATGRTASRNFNIVNHADEGLGGMVSIFGGKLTTYRLMAEKVSDKVAAALGVTAPCRTAVEPIAADPSPELLRKAKRCFPVGGVELMADRLGDSFGPVVEKAYASKTPELVCECELVTMAEIEHVARDEDTHSLGNVRLRTRLGMGTCQGTFCSLRATALLAQKGILFGDSPAATVGSFLQERWKGLRPALWGTQLKEAELGRAIYAATLNIDAGTVPFAAATSENGENATGNSVASAAHEGAAVKGGAFANTGRASAENGVASLQGNATVTVMQTQDTPDETKR